MMGEESRVRWRVVEMSIGVANDPVVTPSVNAQVAWNDVLHRVLEA
jgi:hypothetical protein